MEKSNTQLYEERERRINDAIQLKVPDRVPFMPHTHYFAAKHAGISFQEAWYEPEKWIAANRKMHLELDPDISMYWHAVIGSGHAFEMLDCKQIKWPGHGISPDHTHQFIEQEYMKADEYDAFLADPSDFTIRTYLPRVFGCASSFSEIPPIQTLLAGYAGTGALPAFALPHVVRSFELLHKAALETASWLEINTCFAKELQDLGFPPFAQSEALIPFDLISDLLRGMRGAMLDMFRQPEKLMAAIEVVYPLMLEGAVSKARMCGIPRVFIPLHRGDDRFMSSEQFETFYWPTLSAMVSELIDQGITPCIFFEGVYDQRLDYLSNLPKGKVLGLFDRTDLFKAKKVLGDTMCIAGGMPMSLLQTGTIQEIRDYTRSLIDVVGKDGGFIMSSNTVMDEADPERVSVWKETTMEYGVY